MVMMSGRRTSQGISTVLLCVSALCMVFGAIEDAAAVKLMLNRGLSTKGGSECNDGDMFRFHDAAIVLRSQHTKSGGQSFNSLLSDVPTTWDAQSKTLTTSGGEVIDIDATATPYPTFSMNKGSSRCVYDMDVRAGGGFMGIHNNTNGTVTEIGVWQFGAFDQSRSEGKHCSSLPAKEHAHVAFKRTGSEVTYVVLGSMDGFVNSVQTKQTNLTSHQKGPNPVEYLTVNDGVIYFSTLIDMSRNAPVGCVYPIDVVDGTVLGIGPAGNSTDTGVTRRMLRRTRPVVV